MAAVGRQGAEADAAAAELLQEEAAAQAAKARAQAKKLRQKLRKQARHRRSALCTALRRGTSKLRRMGARASGQSKAVEASAMLP